MRSAFFFKVPAYRLAGTVSASWWRRRWADSALGRSQFESARDGPWAYHADDVILAMGAQTADKFQPRPLSTRVCHTVPTEWDTLTQVVLWTSVCSCLGG